VFSPARIIKEFNWLNVTVTHIWVAKQLFGCRDD
jgi:hypothetical protein